ncbi:MAG: hypothetical protein VYD19_02720 [Myxococcota bacterium]|nr:hypothetical protein [Myxococcota bacterium]
MRREGVGSALTHDNAPLKIARRLGIRAGIQKRCNRLKLTLILLLVPSYVGSAPREVSFTGKPLSFGSDEDWQRRASAWFKSADQSARRRQMRQISRALKRPCSACHTRGFKGYTDPQLKRLTLQMMSLSAERGRECSDCHQGRRGLSALGEESRHCWRLAERRSLFCEACHLSGPSFRKLTPLGRESIPERDAVKAARPLRESPASPAPSVKGGS